jgi:D-beta-D-heptose 7-phosphate kinase/D-beta-D-heptose 1-phosphate adenosyltransferase
MLDKFVYGRVGRISPEAPIPVLSISRQDLMLGGAGNVVSNLAGLGIGVDLIAVTGADEARQSLDTLLEDIYNLHCSLVKDENRPTSIKSRFLAGHQQLLRADHESVSDVSADVEAQIISHIDAHIDHVHAVILSDYGKGCLTQNIIEHCIKAAKTKNIPVLVDPKGQDYSRYKGASVVTPNKKELCEATHHMAVSTDEEMEKATQYLLEISGIESVVATRSADGMSVRNSSNAQGTCIHMPTIAREVFDVSGAGDTVIATIAAALATGSDLVLAACIANAAGGLVVEKVGTAAIRHDELRGFLLEEGHILFRDIEYMYKDTQSDAQKPNETQPQARNTITGFAPVMSWSDAADQVARWKARGLKVGFTNGAFDILHQGHVTYLAKSRAECDRLIVGLNCDASIKRYKSADRPVNAQDARAHVLCALQSTDMVVIFGENPEEEDTPLMLMQALRPDIITKGADYTLDQVVGADFVQSYGGEVRLIDLEDGFSTTNTIKKMSSAA